MRNLYETLAPSVARRVFWNEDPAAGGGGNDGGDPGPADGGGDDPGANDPAGSGDPGQSGDPGKDPAGGDDLLIQPSGANDPAKNPEDPAVPGASDYNWDTDPLGLANLVPADQDGNEFVLAGKYRGANMKEAIQAMEVGVKELNTLLRGKGLVAPEKYDTTGEIFQKLGEGPTEALAELGQNLGLTQKQIEGVAPELVEMMEDLATDNKVRMLANEWEVEPNSPEFNERKGKIERWVNESIGEGRFTAAEIFGENGLARSSGGMQALEIIMNKGQEEGFWTGGSNAETGMSMETARAYIVDVNSAYHDPKHPDHARVKQEADAAYRRQPGGTDQVL